MAKYDVARSEMVEGDAETVSNDLEVRDAPIARIAPHPGEEFRGVGHVLMVPPVIPRR
jgi:hypothetical protein